ncbi:MAG: flagellar hook-associated protein 3 [Cypionkella sp.]|nr:flagellar hook-associated protein 3 [Cypionkella sp.]
MTIGTSLFTRLSTEGFQRLQTQVADLQGRIAAGQNDPAPSADPMRALRLSATAEMEERTARFAANTTAVGDRLAVVDNVLADVAGMSRQLKEIALQSASGANSVESAAALRTQAVKLREALLVAANSRDALGQPLFSGFSGETPFVDGREGIRFTGDAGRPALALSETLTVPTTVNGASVFGTSAGGLFAAVDKVIAALSPPMDGTSERVTAEGSAVLSLNLERTETEVSFQLSGPLGVTEIRQSLVADAPAPLVEAINAASSQTGVQAAIAADGKGILLSASGRIDLSEAATIPFRDRPVARLIGQEGGEAGLALVLKPAALGVTALVAMAEEGVQTLVAARAEIGALGRVTDRQAEVLENRKLALEQARSGLEDLDIAAAVTRLQTLLMTQEAAQQSFVRITGRGLFDYLR